MYVYIRVSWYVSVVCWICDYKYCFLAYCLNGYFNYLKDSYC